LIAESGPPDERAEELKRLVAEMSDEGRVVWVNYNWETELDLEESLRQQEEISELVEDSQFVIKTSVLEEALDNWPGTKELRWAQVMHSGTMWLSESGLALSRVTPRLRPKRSTEHERAQSSSRRPSRRA
jgi:DNA repair exonuclease SbcCD nuclease subunit